MADESVTIEAVGRHGQARRASEETELLRHKRDSTDRNFRHSPGRPLPHRYEGSCGTGRIGRQNQCLRARRFPPPTDKEQRMKLSGAEIIIECLKEQKVDTIFGFPGGAVIHIYDALFKDGAINHVLTAHEQGASHAADGYARASGKVGVCLATSGPGRYEPGHRYSHGIYGFHPHGGHYGKHPGKTSGQGQLPGSGHTGNNHARYQA